MRKTILTLIISLGIVVSAFSQNDEFNTADLQKIATKVEFVGAKNLKNLSNDELMTFYSNIEADRSLIKQININSWVVCDQYKIDNFDIYNYYYKDITRETFNLHCQVLNALMLLDGTIKQIK